jgi:hypothetical protein
MVKLFTNPAKLWSRSEHNLFLVIVGGLLRGQPLESMAIPAARIGRVGMQKLVLFDKLIEVHLYLKASRILRQQTVSH